MTANQLPGSVFSISVPAGWERLSKRAMADSALATFNEFDVYSLGSAFEGLPHFGTIHDRREVPSGMTAGAKAHSYLVSVYTPPFVDGVQANTDQVSIIQRVPLTADERAMAEKFLGDAARGVPVTVNNQPGTVYLDGAGVRLEVVMGRTLVIVHARDQMQALRVGRQLRKVN